MPKIAGIANKPQVMITENAAAETMAGVTSGSVTVRTTVSGRAPETRGLFEAAIDRSKCRLDRHEDEGIKKQCGDKNHSAHRLDVERLHTDNAVEKLVHESGVRTGDEHIGHRRQPRRRDERKNRRHPGEPLEWHIGACHQDREQNTNRHGSTCRAERENPRIDQHVSERELFVQLDEIGKSVTALSCKLPTMSQSIG